MYAWSSRQFLLHDVTALCNSYVITTVFVFRWCFTSLPLSTPSRISSAESENLYAGADGLGQGNLLYNSRQNKHGCLLCCDSLLYEPLRDKTNKMTVHPAKTQISLGIRPVWSEASLCAKWVAKDPSFLHADSEDSDQTGWMLRLIWVFAGRTTTLLVLSWGGSYRPLSAKTV